MRSIIIALAAIFAAGPISTAWATGAQQEMAAENFLQADTNGDGALSLDEFTALIDLNAADGIGRAAMVKRMGKQSMAFGRLDADADGLVTIDEISAIAARAKQ